MRAAVLTLLALAWMVPATRADDELARLRSENAQLKAQLETLQKSCPAAADTRSAIPAPARPAASAPSPPPIAGEPPAAPSIPPGYKLVKVEPVPPYSQTDCKHSPQYSGRRAPWRDEDHWLALETGMSMDDVQRLLGPEHYDVSDGNRIGWQYGKCGASVRGMAVFENGKLVYWTKPVF